MARKKSVLGTIMHCFFMLCLISVQWILWGYMLSFGEDIGGIIGGGLQYLFLNGVGTEPNGTIPHLVFMMFQGMSAVITVGKGKGAPLQASDQESVYRGAFLFYKLRR